MAKRSPFRCFKSGPEIIQLAVTLGVGIPQSLRNVEDLLHGRGIKISHETVGVGSGGIVPARFLPLRSAGVRGRRMGAYSNWQWHLDEAFEKIDGKIHYLWRAVNHEGEVPESCAAKRRN